MLKFISDLRFVDGSVPAPEIGEGISRIIRKLQMKETLIWFDEAGLMIGIEEQDWRDAPYVEGE